MVYRHAFAFASVLALTAGLAACGGGGSSSGNSAGPTGGGGTPTPTPSIASATLPAGPITTFANSTALAGIDHSFGFSEGLNPMVAQFAGGAAAGDIDNDGDIDVFVARGDLQPNLLYVNQGGSFIESAGVAGLDFTIGPSTNGRHSGPTFGDLDGDGDLDLLLGGLEGGPMKLFANDGTGRFTDVTAASGFDRAQADQTISMALGDYDADGDLDVLMAHWGTPRDPAIPGETETLWRNDSQPGAFAFTPVSATTGIANLLAFDLPQGVLGANFDYTFAPGFADIDGDRDLDILMVSDFRGSKVLLNNGNGTFSASTFTPDDENGMGAAIGDFDNDGDFDWFVSSINGNRLFENLGGGSFLRNSASGVEPGGWGWGSCFADFNADGWLDIYQTNGWEAGKDPSASLYVNDVTRLWMNGGDGTFADAAEGSAIAETDQGRGVVCDDFDNDGDVDALLLTAEPTGAAYYWENQLANANSVKVRLRGRAPNTFAVGAIVQLTIADTVQTRMVSVNSNFISHNSTDQIFGMGPNTSGGLRIIWPDGTETIEPNVSAGQTLVIEQP
ncbi:FG-GAP repeat domain protein [Erythrobacter sp. NAP1]|uniref:CRTAC1 family protein n=1 Tax=Erythrobacter sp. NAP1 TaxID=237727 RepID=UPI000068515F|nr:CRTAC1 family protein [Erythrobacter sp. NAP1]EAQ27853.1 FG-GAP repeat domain protein [Erythrobacter sp. NAP1]